MSAIDFSLIICTYNRASRLKATLDSLRQVSLPANLRWELIFVDNNSTDTTRAVLEEFNHTSGLPARYTFEGKQGLSHARNAGVAEAKGDIIAFTDDDVIVDSQWLASLKRAFDEHACMGVGGRVVAIWTTPKPSWVELEGPYESAGPVVHFHMGNAPRIMTELPPAGANMAFRKEAFEKYGLFRTDLGRAGTMGLNEEDSEFGRRLIKAGEKIVYVPSAVVHHPVEPHRATRSYFLKWWLASGRARLRIEGWPKGAICYFGVPRYLFRNFLESIFRWVTTLEPRKRFFRKRLVYWYAGQIVEARRLTKA
jgi:glycosyltransferase involved in cell wall biosynthesis